MFDFAIGDRVYQDNHGLGTVGWVGSDYIGVTFDRHGKVMLKREVADIRPMTKADERQAITEKAAADDATPAVPFFVRETGAGTHSMGSHWQPFFDDAKTVLLKLPEIIRTADAHGGYSQFYPPPSQSYGDWPRGALLLASSEAIADVMGFENRPHRWDDQTPWRSPGGALDDTPEGAQGTSARNTGVATVLRLSSLPTEPNMLCSLFPYSFHGIEQHIVLQQVYVWESGLEAQIEGRLGNVSITFYDIDFVNNRDWYQGGCSCQFVLTGLAYRASPAQERSFTIPRTQEYLDGMEWLSGECSAEVTDALAETFSTESMSMLLPVEEWDVDDYTFQGRIKELWGMSMLGLRAWRMRTTVMRDSPDDLDMDIVVTERAWSGEAPPQIGQVIEGQMWLQGRLWSTSRTDRGYARPVERDRLRPPVRVPSA